MNGKKHIPLLLTFSILLLISSSENEQKNEFQSVKVNKFFNLNYAENPDKTADLKPDTISSRTTSFGRVTRARAIPTRWRCPPENSCG